MSNALELEYTLTSGFTIVVKPLPPYYMDWIEDAFPMPKFPKRKLVLAAGDTVDYEYVPPKDTPDQSNVEEFALYVSYKDTESKIADIKKARDRAKRDFLLSTCVSLREPCPEDWKSDDWVISLESVLPGYVVPSHQGKRYLEFLKLRVIRTKGEMDLVIQSALFPEVRMQGIVDALRGFQPDLVRGEST